MGKSFVVFNKNDNFQKNADIVTRFTYDGRDYLIYSIKENEQNSQVFVSKLIINSEGKYFIENILSEEKGRLNNIVYSIVILIPTESQKGASFDSLVETYLNKISVMLSSDIPTLDSQDYYSNCSIAVTSKLLVDNAIKLYSEKLVKVADNVVSEVPTWTAPDEVISPIPTSVSVQESVVSDLNLQSVTVEQDVNSVDTVKSNSSTCVIDTPNDDSLSNSGSLQSDKFAVVSDPSLINIVQQHDSDKLKKAGFVNNKYIVIGTVCLILAVAVVLSAYFLIVNM